MVWVRPRWLLNVSAIVVVLVITGHAAAQSDADTDQRDADTDQRDADTDALPQRTVVASRCVGGQPLVDGALDEPEWTAGEAGATMTDPSNPAQSPNTVELRALWDDAALYLGIQVQDSDLRMGGEDVWRDDAVEIFFDARFDRTERFSPDDFQIIINAMGSLRYNPGPLGPDLSPGVFQHAVAVGAEGFSVEMRLSWQHMAQWDVFPSEGMLMGLNFVNDDRDLRDGVEERYDFDWMGNPSYHRPQQWGILELSPAGPQCSPADGDADAASDIDSDATDAALDADLDAAQGLGTVRTALGGCIVAATPPVLPPFVLMVLVFAVRRKVT